MDILQQWRASYCAGSPMPRAFRDQATEAFNKVYQQCEDVRYVSDSCIYRVLDPDLLVLGRAFEIDDALYYSFSADLNGIYYFCSTDRHFKASKFILLEAKGQDALDYQKLMTERYENYMPETDRFALENEVISKLSYKNLIGVYLIDLTMLADYRKHRISIEDLTNTDRLKTLLRWED